MSIVSHCALLSGGSHWADWSWPEGLVVENVDELRELGGEDAVEAYVDNVFLHFGAPTVERVDLDRPSLGTVGAGRRRARNA
jgi:hypothetical protein